MGPKENFQRNTEEKENPESTILLKIFCTTRRPGLSGLPSSQAGMHVVPVPVCPPLQITLCFFFSWVPLLSALTLCPLKWMWGEELGQPWAYQSKAIPWALVALGMLWSNPKCSIWAHAWNTYSQPAALFGEARSWGSGAAGRSRPLGTSFWRLQFDPLFQYPLCFLVTTQGVSVMCSHCCGHDFCAIMDHDSLQRNQKKSFVS